MSSSAPLPSGTEVGRFRIVSEISSGGMGRVYRAETLEEVAGIAKGSPVALKIVHQHLLSVPGFFKRFLREADVGKRIRHPNVVATYDLDGIKVGTDTVLYMAMELVEGKTLWQHFQELGTIPENFARHLAREVARGLAAIHATGVVHRDVKPENIMVAEGGAVKLVDLGVARIEEDDHRLSSAGAFIGSSLYAAPEQFRSAGKPLDARADLYALGVILYELVTGAGPHDAEDLAGIVARALDEVPPPLSDVRPDITPFFSSFVATLLAKDRNERFASAEEVADVVTEGEESPWWRSRGSEAPVGATEPTESIGVDRSVPIVARDAELAELESALREASAGEGRVVLVRGEAGSGKTRLAAEFVARLAARGELVHVLHGGFAPAGAAAASAAFDEACRRFAAKGSVADMLRPRFAGAAQLAGAFAAHLRGEAASAALDAAALSAALGRFFTSLAAERPTVVFVDGLESAPPAGLELFSAVAESARTGGFLLVGAARLEAPAAWTEAVAALPHARRIALGRFGLKDAAIFVIAAAGSEHAADEIGFGPIEESGGVPGFLLEIVRDLRRSGRVTSAGAPGLPSPHAAAPPLPEKVRAVLAARLAGIAEEDRELLDMAARLGAEFDPRVAADAMSQDRVAVIRRLSRLERTQRLVHAVGERFVFDHPGLVAEIVASTPEALGREYDARLGDAIEALPDDGDPGTRATQLTDLFLRAGHGARARPHVAAALEYVDATQPTQTSARLGARILAAPGVVSGTDRYEILLPQAARYGVLGRADDELAAVNEALDVASAANDLPRRARALAAAGRAYLHVARYGAAITHVEEALEIATSAGLESVEAEARAVLGRVRCETGSYQDALAEHTRELALRNRLGDAPGAAAAHGFLGDVKAEMGRYDRAHVEYRTERELGLSARDRFARARTKLRLGRLLFVLGRYADAHAEFTRARTLFQLLGALKGQARAATSLGEVALAVSDMSTAERFLNAAAALCRECQMRHLLGRVLLGLASAADARGDANRATRLAAQSLEMRRFIGDRAGIVDSLIVTGRLRAAAGLPLAAKTALDEARTIARQIGRTGSEVLVAAHLATLPGGDVQSALTVLAAFEAQTPMDDRIEAHSLLWRATGAEKHLEESRQLVARVLSHVPPQFRADAAARRGTVIAPVQEAS